MRQLNLTGSCIRVRKITAGFLCKHLLIDWRWGEAYFARKLLDYELSVVLHEFARKRALERDKTALNEASI